MCEFDLDKLLENMFVDLVSDPKVEEQIKLYIKSDPDNDDLNSLFYSAVSLEVDCYGIEPWQAFEFFLEEVGFKIGKNHVGLSMDEVLCQEAEERMCSFLIDMIDEYTAEIEREYKRLQQDKNDLLEKAIDNINRKRGLM